MDRPEPAPTALSDRAPASTASGGFAFAPSADQGMWHPVRPGVDVTPNAANDAMSVRYQRERGKPAGVALMLPPDACERLDSITVRASAAPSQRVQVCLKDANGVVWALPSIKLDGDAREHVLMSQDIRPDPFQNAGKSVPAAPDWSSMRMLMLLDISGFMGAPVESCEWRIESVRGEEAQR